MLLKTHFSTDPVHSGAWTETLPAKYVFVDRAELIQITSSLRAASPKCCACACSRTGVYDHHCKVQQHQQSQDTWENVFILQSDQIRSQAVLMNGT